MAELGLPAGGALSAYLGVRSANQRAGALDTQNLLGQLGALSKIQQMQQQQQVQGVLASNLPPDKKIEAVSRVNPQLAGVLSQLHQQQREAAVFSPENVSRFTTPGAPGQPAEELAPEVAGPPRPAVAPTPPQVNLDALRQQAAMTGPRGMETYSAHVAAEQQKRLQLQQMQQTAQQNFMLAMQRAQNQADRDAATADYRKLMMDMQGEFRRSTLALQRESLELRRDMAGIGARAGAAPSATTGTGAIPTDVIGPAGTGASGFFGGLANTITDAIGLGIPLPRVERATQALKNLEVQTVTMLQDAVPGRPSNYLMQKLEALAVKPGSLFMGDERAKIRLEQTRDMLKTEISRMENEVLAIPQLYKSQEISKTRASHSQLRQLAAEYDTIISSFDRKKPGASDLEERLKKY